MNTTLPIFYQKLIIIYKYNANRKLKLGVNKDRKKIKKKLMKRSGKVLKKLLISSILINNCLNTICILSTCQTIIQQSYLITYVL